MIIETAIITALQAIGEPVYYGTAPQPEGDEPTPLPVLIVNRIASRWPYGFCGTDGDLSILTVQIDYHAETAERARQLADAGRSVLIGMDHPGLAPGQKVAPALDNELSLRDDGTRSWRVTQQWAVTDYSPAI